MQGRRRRRKRGGGGGGGGRVEAGAGWGGRRFPGAVWLDAASVPASEAIVALCSGIWNLFGAIRDFGRVSSNPLGKGKIRFIQKDVKGSSEPSDFQA